VARFFEAYGVTSSQVRLRLNLAGRSTGEGVVQLESEELARRACAERNRQFLFGRYLELFPLSYEEAQAFSQPPEPEKGFSHIEGASYLRLRGLPYSATYRDVIAFFADIESITDDQVVLGRAPDGRLTGEAWVQLRSAANAETALSKKQRSDLGGRYVELFSATEQEAHSSVSGSGNSRSPGCIWVKVRGLPYSAVAEDVAQFFADFEVKSDKVVMGRGPDARATGEAWVQFASEERASKAISSRDRGHIGGRYVELFPATSHEVQRIMDQQRAQGTGAMANLSPAQGTTYLKLRGIPYSATPEDIAAFLEGFHVMPGQVAIGRGADGRPSGDAWVQLADERTAAAAMQAKNRASLGGRYVEIFPSNFQEALRASGGAGLDGYGPVQRLGEPSRSHPYDQYGAALSPQPGAAGYPCGACAAGASAALAAAGAAAGCAGMPTMNSWMYPSSYPVGLPLDPATAAQYGAAAQFSAAQYGAMAQYSAAAQQYSAAAQYSNPAAAAQYSAAAAAAAAAQYSAAAAQQYGAPGAQYGVGGACPPAMQYAMVAGYGGVQYPLLTAAGQPQSSPAAGAAAAAPAPAPA